MKIIINHTQSYYYPMDLYIYPLGNTPSKENAILK